MCGFAGRVDLGGRRGPPERRMLLHMLDAVAHRGPDEHGIYRDHKAGLAHARLSLIDLAGGTQPMADRSRRIVFNGEIYNHVELRHELEARGRRFRTRSDTEVILHAVDEWGLDAMRRFNGQWAFAIWDPVTAELTVSRDRLGICPLHLRAEGGTVWFASEVKAILTDPAVPRALDPAGIRQVFTYWASLAPRTVFAGIEELPPATSRVYRAGAEPIEHRYWIPDHPPAGSSPRMTMAEATEELAAALTEATRLRMTRADVPVGAYLSGGLDSSLTAWMARQVTAAELRTFSLRFDDAEFDEGPYQAEMAAALGARHESLTVTAAAIADVFPDVIRHTERPVLRTAPAPLYLLSSAVRDSGVSAVLTGEGADEVLAGYDIFREARIRAFWARRPSSAVRPLLFDRIYPYLARSPAQAKGMAEAFWGRGLERVGQPGFSHEPRWETTSALQRFLAPEFAAESRTGTPTDPALDPPLDAAAWADALRDLPPGFASWPPLSKAQHLETATLLSPYILSSQGDRMLMAHAVEGRFPFLDPHVVDLCNSLPPGYKLAGLDEKHLLKRVASGKVPSSILHRAKQPYRAPGAAVFLAGARPPDYVEAVLSPGAVTEAGVFVPGAVSALVAKLRRAVAGGRAVFGNTDDMALIGILSTQLLYFGTVRADEPCGQVDRELAIDVDLTGPQPD